MNRRRLLLAGAAASVVYAGAAANATLRATPAGAVTDVREIIWRAYAARVEFRLLNDRLTPCPSRLDRGSIEFVIVC
jgi:hypothetical protein